MPTDQPDEHETSYGLVLPFDTDEREFTRGVEVGMLHATLRAEPELPYSATIHATNAEMAMRLGECHGLAARSEDLNDDFLVVTFEEADRG